MALVVRFILPGAVSAREDVFVAGAGLFSHGVLDIPAGDTTALSAVRAAVGAMATEVGTVDNSVTPPPVQGTGNPYPQYLTLAGAATSVTGGSDALGTALKAAYGSYEFARLPVLRCTSAVLTKWASAVAAVRSGTRDAKLLMVGDSTTIGIYGNGNGAVPDYGSPAATLTALLDRGYLPTVNGLGIPPSSVTATDTRWTVGSGWTPPTGGLSLIGFGGKSSAFQATNAAAALVYADPRIWADTFDVYYVGNPGIVGTLTITATGGGATTVDCGAVGSVNIYKATVTAAAAAWTNGVSITSGGGHPVFVIGVEPRLAASGGVIRVANAGASGTDSTSWTAYNGGSASNNYNGLASIKAYAPDLTIINLQINDANSGALAVATHRSQMQALVTAAQVSGDVILVSCNPSQADAVSSLERQYTADEKATFTTAGYIDYLAACGSWTRYNGLGCVYDSLHPNAKGYEHSGRLLADVVRRIA